MLSVRLVFFFLQCLKQYVELLIKEGLETAISCPDSACPKGGHLLENEVLIQGMHNFYSDATRSVCPSGADWCH